MKRFVVHQKLVIFAAICGVIISAFIPLLSVNAEGIDWITNVPKASVETGRTVQDPTMSNNIQACQPQHIMVDGVASILSSCVYQAQSFQMAFYTATCTYEDCGNTLQMRGIALKFSGDTQFHQMDNNVLPILPFSWKISPYTDTVIINYGATFRVVKNFPSQVNFASNLNKFYLNIDSEHSKILNVFADGDFYSYGGAVDMSANGQWAVLQFTSHGHIKINLNDYSYRLFTNDTSSASVGLYEYAISNDGRFIATGGKIDNNVGISGSVYDTGGSCGEVSSGGINRNWLSAQNLSNPCLGRPYGPSILQAANDGSRYVLPTNFLSFSDDGGELELMAKTAGTTLSSAVTRWYKLSAANYTGTPSLDYLALGDSYSSGEGDTEKDANGNRYYRQYTNTLGSATEPRERCHISTRSYPYILAQGMNNLALNTRWNTVACSGATAWDIKSQGSATYKGQSDRLKDFSVDSFKMQALNEFIPGRQKQIEFVKKYQPKVITLTMGGNDIGFADKVGSCAILPSTCDLVDANRDRLSNEIRNQFDNLKSLYEDLYKASGSRAKIYVLGYPSFINGDTNANCALNIGFLNHEERELIANGISYLNNTIKTAAIAAGVKYIDIENSLNGHRMCDDGNKYITGATDIFDWNNYKQESFHPNAKGNNEMAMVVWDKVNHASLIDYDICPNSDSNICPNSSVTKDSIPTPAYFATNTVVKNTQYKQMTAPDQAKLSLINITLGSYSFAPNSTANATIHSDPINFGTYTVDSTGSLNVSVSMPGSIPAGYHTLTVSGISNSGEEIEYEQIILVRGSNPNDIDDDGIIDTQDKCLFYAPSNIDVDKDGKDDACDPEIAESPVITPSPSPSPSPTSTPSPNPQSSKNNIITIVVNVIVKVITSLLKLITSIFHK